MVEHKIMDVRSFVEYPYVHHDNFDHSQSLSNFAGPTEQNSMHVPNVCRYFLSGNCRYGDFCRNSHVIQQEDTPLMETSTGQAHKDNSNNNNNNSSKSCTDTPEVSTIQLRIDAPEFVPRSAAKITNATSHSNNDSVGASSQNSRVSYAQIVSGNSYNANDSDMHYAQNEVPLELMAGTLCPYIQSTITKADGTISCRYGERCPYQHGDLCEMCGLYCLHPTDQNQRKVHEKVCMSILEKDMEHSFAVARSKDKTCGICFEVITEKASRGGHRFGILPNCNHIFCLPCIRKWRQAKNFDSTITRACPECRIESHYVCPSLYWVDTKEEKEKLLTEYKEALRQQNCKYFNRGEGRCPFGNKCFYKHALPNGELVDVGIPQQRRRYDLHGENNIVERVILWNFLQARDDDDDDDDYDDDEYSISTFSGTDHDPSDLD